MDVVNLSLSLSLLEQAGKLGPDVTEMRAIKPEGLYNNKH